MKATEPEVLLRKIKKALDHLYIFHKEAPDHQPFGGCQGYEEAIEAVDNLFNNYKIVPPCSCGRKNQFEGDCNICDNDS